jgi:hypothetical protein
MAHMEGFGRDWARKREKVEHDVTPFFCFVSLLIDWPTCRREEEPKLIPFHPTRRCTSFSFQTTSRSPYFTLRICSEIFLRDVWMWFVFSSTARESNNRCWAVFESTVLLSYMMQCNLSIHKICVWTEIGVVIDLHCSMYRTCTHDFSDLERHRLHMTVESKECVIGTRNIIALGFTTDLRQSGTKLRTRCFPDFVSFLRGLFLKHRQSMGFCQHDGPCFTNIQNNRYHYRSRLCICSRIN